MEKENKVVPTDWDYIESIVSNVWEDEWLLVNPLELKMIEKAIDEGNPVDLQLVGVPEGMFFTYSITLEDLYYIMSIVYFVIQLRACYHSKSEKTLSENQVRDMIEEALNKFEEEKQSKIYKLIVSKIDKLISQMEKERHTKNGRRG